ncbi:MAG TPA: Holliday junction branch migration protein RuvA [Lacipirellulaceae bacterium]|jgi:Holliday junction DNA helicase RuvA|nr:Holliday junction branch migration protein RuvA [Lacipirellulaceae bacterium]
MITKVTGTPVALAADTLTLAVGAFEYEILIPEFARRNLQDKLGREVSLHTLEYLEGNAMQGRLIPRLVGFLSPIEREFFDMFCEVDGVGVKKALRAMVRPVQDVATMIEEQDAKGLATLPGIGPATAERIIAKLRRRVPKFALLVAGEVAAATGVEVERDLLTEAFEVLKVLGHSDSDARRLLDGALDKKTKYKDVDALLHAVYEKSHGE